MFEKSLIDKIRNYLTLGSANFLASAIMAIFWMYLASQLDKSEYGLLGYLISIAVVAHTASTIGLGRTIVVYGAKKENIVSPAYTLGLITSVSASIAVYVITQNVAVSFLTWGLMIYFLKTSDLNSKKQYGAFAKYRILRSGLTIGIGIFLFQVVGINGVILGFALSTLPTLGGLINYVKNEKISIAVLKPKMKFMLNSYLITLSNTLFRWGDKILIGSLLGFPLLGSYHLAAQYLFLLNTIPRALFVYLLPQESEGKRNKKIKILSVGVSCVIALFSVILLPYVFDIFFPQYADSILPAQILSVAIIPITIHTIFESKFFGKEVPHLILIGVGLETILYFLLIIFLGGEYGIIGLAIGFLIATVVRAAYMIVIDQIVIKRQFSKSKDL